MNKYVFPGADASIPLHWVIKELELVGFEVKQVDVLGVHYSATILRWYQNWLKNKENVVAKYGDRYVFPLPCPLSVSRESRARLTEPTRLL
jgi:cyclopropane fatty-acyl-phospholipid synthase-like methyltransferase